MTQCDLTISEILQHRAELSAKTGLAFGASVELTPRASNVLRLEFNSQDEADAAYALGRPLTDAEVAMARDAGANLVTFARLKAAHLQTKAHKRCRSLTTERTPDMPIIRNALSIPIELTQKLAAKPERTTHPSGLTPRQLEICRELGVTPEAFAAAQRGEIFPGARRA